MSIQKNVLYLFYNIAQRNIKKEIFRRIRVDIELCQHGSWPISIQDLQMQYYKYNTVSGEGGHSNRSCYASF